VVSSSQNTLCAGSTVSLQANGASAYTWQPGSQIGNTILVTPSVTTIYTVSGETGTCIKTSTIPLSVMPAPVLSISSANPLNLCAGDTVITSVTGALNYTWLPMGVSSNSISFFHSSSNTYTILGSSSQPCVAKYEFTVNSNPQPILSAQANNTLICKGEPVILTAQGAVSYTWNAAQIGSLVLVSPLVSQIYTVIGIGAGTCSDTAFVAIEVAECISISETDDEKRAWRIYPNPANDYLIIEKETTDDITGYIISDLSGRQIRKGVVTELETRITVSELPAGIYLFQLTGGKQGVQNSKFIKN